jgi:dTDP-4-amino-4,6-dideoxygalactose transaminase
MNKQKLRVPFLDLAAQYESIKDEIWPAMQDVVEKSQFILGPAVDRFERNFAAYCGAKHCLATGSGTDSLHLAFLAAGIGPGDEVITQANTFVATLEAIAYTGARIVLVDVAPPTYTLDIEAVRAAITDATKAIVPVHIFGQPCDIDAVYDLAAERELAVIEDASQAHGAQWRGRRIGSRGVASFSFYPGKNLGAYGEGGGVTSNDAAFDERMRELRNHGGLAKYVHSVVGYNYRMDGIQGAVLDVKLPHLEAWTEGRRRAAHRYDKLLEGVPKPEVPNDARHVYHIYPIFVDDREAVRAALDDRGVATNVHYPIACHLQAAYAYLGYGAGAFPHSEYLADHELSLPMFSELTIDQIDYVSDAVREVI